MLTWVKGPLIATSIASKGGTMGGVQSWRAVYFTLVGIAFVNVAGVVVGFRDSLWQKGTRQGSGDSGSGGRGRAAMLELKETVKSKALWLLSLAYFLQLGATFTAGGTFKSRPSLFSFFFFSCFFFVLG